MTICQTADAIVQNVPLVVPSAQAHLLNLQSIDGVICGPEGSKHGRIDIHFSFECSYETFVGHVFLYIRPSDALERALWFFVTRDEQTVHLGPQTDKFFGGLRPGLRFEFAHHLLVRVTVQRMVGAKLEVSYQSSPFFMSSYKLSVFMW